MRDRQIDRDRQTDRVVETDRETYKQTNRDGQTDTWKADEERHPFS